MGYDIELFIPQPGKSLQESYESQCNSLAPDKTNEVAVRQLSESYGTLIRALMEINPRFERGSFQNTIELSDLEYGIQICFYEVGSASISIPYGHQRLEAKRAYQRMAAYLSILGGVGQFHAYDPQMERFYDPQDPSLLAFMLGINDHISSTITKIFGPKTTSKPWWKIW